MYPYTSATLDFTSCEIFGSSLSGQTLDDVLVLNILNKDKLKKIQDVVSSWSTSFSHNQIKFLLLNELLNTGLNFSKLVANNLRSAMFNECSLIICKMLTDKTADNVKGILDDLRNITLKEMIFENEWLKPELVIEAKDYKESESPIAYYKKLEKYEQEKNRFLFEELYQKTVETKFFINERDRLRNFKDYRDKYLVHQEFKTVDEKRKFFEASEFGLNWHDPIYINKSFGTLLYDLDVLVNRIGRLQSHIEEENTKLVGKFIDLIKSEKYEQE